MVGESVVGLADSAHPTGLSPPYGFSVKYHLQRSSSLDCLAHEY